MSREVLEVIVEDGNEQRHVETRELPLLDLGPYLAGDETAKAPLAAELRDACETVGFLAIKNHGVADELLERMLAENERFCAMPMDEKLKITIDQDQRGYIRPKATMIRHSTYHDNTKFDLNETTVFATEHAADDPNVRAGKQFYGQNQWPENLPGFRETVDEYMSTIEALGKKLLPLWALALDMPEDYFIPYFDNSYTYFRMAHYPPKPHADENEFALGAHADTGFMTFLPSPDVEGLEIMDTSGVWFRPLKVPGVIHINIGQFLERWSNGRFMATPHRVAVPRDHDRYTIPVFVNPSFEPVVECVPTCMSPDNPPKYPPESYGQFFKWYMSNSYPHYDDFHKGA
jgi:isopenicillin N synthase-like dioxygenase